MVAESCMGSCKPSETVTQLQLRMQCHLLQSCILHHEQGSAYSSRRWSRSAGSGCLAR
jgi:hypothetical protein